MITTYKTEMDLWRAASPWQIEAAQGDCLSRAVEISLYTAGAPWQIPEGVTAVVRYRREDGVDGEYDTLPDGTRAWQAEENRLTVMLLPQMLTQEGNLLLDVELISADRILGLFPFYLHVREKIGEGKAALGDYRRITGFLPLPEQAEVGQAVVVRAVDSRGKPTAVETRPYRIAQEIGTSETAVMSQKAVTDAIAAAAQAVPEFVNGLDQCTDPGKLYVLPDGYLYVYMRSVLEQDPNVFAPAEASLNLRLNSSGAEVALNGSYCTDFIPVDLTALDPYVVRLPEDFHPSYGNQRAILYDENKTILLNCYINNRGDGDKVSHVYTGSDGGCYFYLGYQGDSAAPSAPDDTLKARAKYVRFSVLINDTAAAITRADLADVSIRFDALYSLEEVYQWCNTGRAYQAADYEDRIIALEGSAADHLPRISALETGLSRLEEGDWGKLPDYWRTHLAARVAEVNRIQETCGMDCFSFPVLTDIHISANLGMASGLLAGVIMDRCQIRHGLCLGDVATRDAARTAQDMDESFAEAEALLAPIRDRLLQTQGNHDGAWGASDLDGDGDVEGVEYYANNFTQRKLHSLIYRKVGAAVDAHFDATGSGYYVDDPSNRVRYLILNSHCHPYEENPDGTVRYNTMRLFRFRQAQYDLAVEALSTVPGKDWAVVSASHVPVNDDYAAAFGGQEGDHVLMRRLLAAYRDKLPFAGSFPGTYGQDAVAVAADFTDAQGLYIAHFAGHTHQDSSGVYDGIRVITTRCDAHEENDHTSAEYKERAANSITEQSFDVFTVDRENRLIYATKIGAGSDRVIPF